MPKSRSRPPRYTDPGYPRKYTPPPVPPPPPPPSSAITLYRPNSNAIIPKSPGAIVKFSPPSIPKPPPSLGTGIAGAFKAVPKVAAPLRGGIGLVARRVPWIALGFVAFDAFLIACAAGILPGNICPRPDNPMPGGKAPQFSGGQCRVVYVLHIETWIGIAGGGFKSNNGAFQEVLGPVFGVEVTYTGDGVSSFGYNVHIVHLGSGGAIQRSSHTGGGGGDKNLWRTYVVVLSIVRKDGQPDNCGDLAPSPSPRQPPDFIQNIQNIQNNYNNYFSSSNFLPPKPLPPASPRVSSPPSPLPDIHIDFGDNYFGDGIEQGDLNLDYRFSPGGGGNYQDFPDIFNNNPPSPQPRTKDPNPFVLIQNPPGNTGGLNNIPEIPPPLPDKLPDDASDSDKYQMRQNKEITDKLYKLNGEILEIQSTLEKQNKVLENLQKLIDFEVEGSQIIKRCDDIDFVYSYKEKILPAINRQLSHIKSIEQIILDEVCEIENAAVVASPEWWQVRIQGDIPQIVLIFRFLTTRTYHKLVVPHPLNTDRLVNPPIKTYKKGNWQGEIVNIDNTKFLCNCGTKGEAIRLLDIAASLIDPVFLGNPIRRYYAERKGQEVSPGDMLATSAMYFPTGQRNMRPEWRVAFTKDAQ